MKFNIKYKKSGQEKIKKYQSLRNFFEQKLAVKISGNQVTVWKEEPMVKTFRKNNLNSFCFLIIIGAKLVNKDMEYFVNKIEEESGKIAKKPFLIKLLYKIRDENDQTLLHHAALKGKLNCLKVLIGNKFDISGEENDEELTSCLFACKNKTTKFSNCLKENSVNVYDKRLLHPLHMAAGGGHRECVELLTDTGGDINAKDEHDLTPLHLAAGIGKVDCLEVLLANGADVNAKDENDWTPLHKAADFGKVDCLEVLLASEVNVNARTKKQHTSLHLIGMSFKGSKAEMERCVELLINAGADIDAKDDDDWTPLHSAAAYGNVNCLEALLANGAGVNAEEKNDYSPLHIAALNGKINCLEVLLANGADANAEDEDDWTPLHHAAYYGNVDSLEVLLANQSDFNARNNKQCTPLHIIGLSPEGSKAQKERCAEMLISAGADVDAKDEDGDTVFAYSFFQTLRVERPDLFTQN